MLKALYEYGRDHPDVCLPPGCTYRTLKWIIALDKWGDFLGIRQSERKQVICPNAGSKAGGIGNVNIIMEKASNCLGLGAKDESLAEKFRKSLIETEIPECLLVAKQLFEKLEELQEAAEAKGIKPGDPIGFSVDGILLSDLQPVRDWWAKKSRNQDNPTSIDLVTGDPCVPQPTYKKIPLKAAGGGQSSGVLLVSHNKKAFQSYQLTQNQNCPLSEETASMVMDAFIHLAEEAPRIGEMKFLHWYDHEIKAEEDILASFFPEIGSQDVELDRDAMAAKASDMVESIKKGRIPGDLSNYVYHIAVTKPEGARMAIRQYTFGTYGSLNENLKAWFDDMALTSGSGKGLYKPGSFGSMLFSLLTVSEKESKTNKWGPVNHLVMPLLQAAITNTPIPDAVCQKSIASIRSKLYEDGETAMVNRMGKNYQWIKIWLCRKERQKGRQDTMEYLNENHPETAYHCGRAMAVYGDLQNFVMRNVNTGVTERYYASCSQSPALVLGTLQKLSNHHMKKVESPWFKKLYQDILASAYSAMGDNIPKRLTLEQQAYFALGYQQQTAAMNKAKNEYFMEKEKKKEEKKNGNSKEPA